MVLGCPDDTASFKATLIPNQKLIIDLRVNNRYPAQYIVY